MATPAEIEADLKKILWQNNPSSAASDGSSSRGQDGSHRLQRPSSKQRRRGDRPPPDGRPERGREGPSADLAGKADAQRGSESFAGNSQPSNKNASKRFGKPDSSKSSNNKNVQQNKSKASPKKKSISADTVGEKTNPDSSVNKQQKVKRNEKSRADMGKGEQYPGHSIKKGEKLAVKDCHELVVSGDQDSRDEKGAPADGAKKKKRNRSSRKKKSPGKSEEDASTSEAQLSVQDDSSKEIVPELTARETFLDPATNLTDRHRLLRISGWLL